MPDMTKAQKLKADKVADKILSKAWDLADDEGTYKTGQPSSFVNYERDSFCTFRRGDIEYEVLVSARRVLSVPV